MEPGSSSRCIAGRVARVEIDLALDEPAWLDDLPDAEALARRAATAAVALACPGGPALAMALVLAGDDRLRSLNRDWRGIDKPTNVLSFPAEALEPGRAPVPVPGAPEGEPVELGDVVIAHGVMRHEAAQGAIPLDHHLSHLVVHGTLHLLGYDHEADDEAEAMEAMERRVLAGLGVPDPYAGEEV
jgi:probable rRNA maturation factor